MWCWLEDVCVCVCVGVSVPPGDLSSRVLVSGAFRPLCSLSRDSVRVWQRLQGSGVKMAGRAVNVKLQTKSCFCSCHDGDEGPPRSAAAAAPEMAACWGEAEAQKARSGSAHQPGSGLKSPFLVFHSEKKKKQHVLLLTTSFFQLKPSLEDLLVRKVAEISR